VKLHLWLKVHQLGVVAHASKHHWQHYGSHQDGCSDDATNPRQAPRCGDELNQLLYQANGCHSSKTSVNHFANADSVVGNSCCLAWW